MSVIETTRKVIANTSKVDIMVITFSFAVSVTYIVSYIYWQQVGGVVGIILAATLFLVGQVIIAMRGTYSTYKKSITWERNTLPTLHVVRQSLESNLVLLSDSKSRENAYQDARYQYPNPTGEMYRDSFRWFLKSIAPSDFISKPGLNRALPLVSRLKNLRENILIPTRDLLRWGLIMNRLYEEGEPEDPSQLFGQSVLEMVSSLYLIECERFLSYLEHNSSILQMPKELAGENIIFADIQYRQTLEKKGGYIIIGNLKISAAADILINNLNSICGMGHDLTRQKTIPAFPAIRDGKSKSGEFCERYLTVAWYRSVLTHMGWNLVRPEDEQSALVS